VYFCSRHVSRLLGVSTAASIGSLPFAAAYFNMITPVSVLANMVIVPIAFFILAQGILSTLTGVFSNSFSILFNNVNWLLAHVVLWTVHFFAQIPDGHLYLETPGFHGRVPCEITVLDLGASTVIHLRVEGQDWLIDCGNKLSYETIVVPYLHSRGVNRLDGFILSHGSAKFNGAAIAVETDFQPRVSADSFLDDRSPSRLEFHQWLGEHGLTRTQYRSGDVLKINDTKITILYPSPGSNARLADDKALVMRLDRDGCSVLFMSSSGAVAERWLLENKREMLRADLLVTNSSGRDASAAPDFIDAVQPKAIVCSSSDFPASAHIDETWAREIVGRGIKLFRQDQTGGVSIGLGAPDGEYTVKAFLGDEIYRGTSHHAE
jgi:beta-lactamase superfamily II metal-dependent hydrolase